ncbi:MAG: DUF2461 domain-containing protein [Psychroserpens sp.]|uniref:DUF2461 domain-containing protein n=1 Tax=Psychroserpens sp. TaxID=2020870 RepID=UPI003C73B374
MVQKEYIFRFLRDLRNNNSKDWMDANRDRYETAKACWLNEIEKILERLSKHDAHFSNVKPKDAIERINNNLMYHPEKPTYKDHFGCEPTSVNNKGAVYISVGPSHSFIGGGIHNPQKDILDKVRKAIDYDGKKLQNIIDSADIKDYFGGLSKDHKKLKTSPKGYSKDHKHIELLRRKDFTVIKQLTEDDVTGTNFIDIVEQAYLKMKPLNDYMSKAISVDD